MGQAHIDNYSLRSVRMETFLFGTEIKKNYIRRIKQKENKVENGKGSEMCWMFVDGLLFGLCLFVKPRCYKLG